LNYFAASFFKALGNVNVTYLKIPKKHVGCTKGPCGPNAAYFFKTPAVWANMALHYSSWVTEVISSVYDL